ncbi:ATP-binding protein [Halorussus lipolyticus]|uniref:ATP-binding protein n=1 Tax=Halorussus lipolyticus TaxID=3034024 RepID=UPI0023E76CE6|nr:ATP-binding protein [Halorussus sp. DT80]
MDPTDDAFFREAKSQIRTLGDGLLALERDDEEASVAELFRVAHSLKGSCRTHGLGEAGDLAHVLEDVLDAIRGGEVEPTPELVDAALETVDLLEATVRDAAVGSGVDGDPEEAGESLRETLDRARAESSADTAPPADSARSESADSGDDWDPADADLSDDVVEALEESSEFDDLDSLLDGMDDPEGDDEELDGWGMLGEDAGEDESADDQRDEPQEAATPDEPSSFFERTKAEIESGDESIDALQDDIDSVEFGEFDDEDTYTIEELIELEPDEEAAGEPAADESAEAVEAAGEPAADESAEAVEAAGEPAADESAEAVEADAEVSADESAEELEVAGESTDDETDSANSTIVSDNSTTSEDTSIDVSGGAGIVSEPDDETDSDDADSSESVAADDPLGLADGDSVGGDESVEDGATPDDPDEASDEETGTFVFGEPEDDTPPETADPDDSSTGTESVSDDVPDADSLPDTDPLPDADSLTDAVPDSDSMPDEDLGVDLSGDFDGMGDDLSGEAETGMDVSVDEEMEAFESRFGDLLGEAPTGDDDEGAVFRSAVSTIEESSLDADQFPTADAAAPGETGEFDRLQAMTVDVDTADRLLDVAEELSLSHLRLDEAVTPETDEAIREEVSNLLRIVTDYRRTVMDVRLMALETAIETIPRTVRDVARAQDKAVSVAVDDADVELDRSIIDRLRDPLVHLARNAVDHGIEPPDEREKAGKPREGTVEISAERVGDEVVIELSDDGRGVDPEAVREQAVERGVVSPAEADRLSDSETYDLLFEPGFTTTDEVTDVSGRGVGMDVVNRTVADLNGTVTVESELGAGTTVRLTVPVSIALTEVLFVEVEGRTFGIPMTAVEQITPTPPVETVDGREVVRRSDLDLVGGLPEGVEAEDAYPHVDLREALELSQANGKEAPGAPDDQIVWIRAETGRRAVRCDRVVASQEVVVRPYGDLLRDVPGVSGATTLGDGRAVNVLDTESL